MAEDHLRTLRRLMKRYNIRFLRLDEGVPELHAETFNNIKKLGNYQFDVYSAGVNIWSSKEPWKQQIKARAEWLCQRAERLFGQERNEAGWRFGLENHILGRFLAEVACSRCRARIWQSEIEATLSNNQIEHARELEERRKRRRPCQCPPNERIKDFYEIGTNPLFDDRAQEFVVYDELLRSQLPKQGPDRVLGLQNTRNLDSLLQSPVRPDLAKQQDDIVSDILKTTPFKSQADPLLFPFLLLEAKSETSSSGFDAIQVQSAFPIYALLKLQEELRSYVDWSPGEERFEPLVWFLASRGDQWKVYGAHLDKGADGDPTRYGITLLWSGSLLHKDDALQLLLIVDYIMDWARDIYRIAILKQLQSLVTGQAFDQISIVDSEIISMRRDPTSWIPAPPSTVSDDMEELSDATDEDGPPLMSLDHQALLDFRIPNSKHGTVRSASLIDFRFDCFYLTQRLVPSFLQVIGGRQHNPRNTEKAARHIINFITQFDEVLVMSGADLELLENLWTGTDRSDPEAREEDFYVIMECSWYFTHTWQITRQLSCFAISKTAFDIMKSYARFSVRRKGIENLHQRERRCSPKVLRQCVECLRAGSPWQVLLAAISSTLVTIYPLPVRRREDFAPPVDVLGFGYAREDRVRTFILKYLKRNLWKPKRYTTVSSEEMHAALREGYTMDEVFAARRDKPPKHTDQSWKRISEQRTHILEEECHNSDLCERCCRGSEATISAFAHGYLDTRNQPLLSGYGTVLVVSLRDPAGSYVPDACVFALRPLRDLKDNMALSIMIEDLMQGALVYHTMKCGARDIISGDGMKRNLPLPFRPTMLDEEVSLLNWIRELRDEPLLDRQDHPGYEAWCKELYDPHMLMYYLSIGHLEHEALMLAKKEYNRRDFYLAVVRIREENGKENFFDTFFNSAHRKVKLSGNALTPRFITWDAGKDFLRQEYPRQFQYISSLNMTQRPTAREGSM
ncbi:hypothetical protein IFM58399_09317 [Aspergillus lentulus]|uniref:Heterokaryon incompatibility domain-containing protein n=1 Tax=Aspergillus lentulus TaxID=293939 RepID=A0ABQ1AKD9_ASPLE|nr:uncharacterized protein IFM58399_09317 [Aspergillus lentulus]GFF52416.1 hypothetical protein IFM58399_09317 [Aspergillus lentulus]GFF80037.1 hypothetical protein IFM62136_10212 [Aspergillus lentulus]GFF83483.1 hypothetical protein IFM60648_06712 [Aspergillus lentulus]GFF97449.1 hypothetical protein IFM47457_11400 [Aspergillus lentulus]GFG07532.1 hypothetical protein IFM61392_04906 [Aspergillus lentulus]